MAAFSQLITMKLLPVLMPILFLARTDGCEQDRVYLSISNELAVVILPKIQHTNSSILQCDGKDLSMFEVPYKLPVVAYDCENGGQNCKLSECEENMELYKTQLQSETQFAIQQQSNDNDNSSNDNEIENSYIMENKKNNLIKFQPGIDNIEESEELPNHGAYDENDIDLVHLLYSDSAEGEQFSNEQNEYRAYNVPLSTPSNTGANQEGFRRHMINSVVPVDKTSTIDVEIIVDVSSDEDINEVLNQKLESFMSSTFMKALIGAAAAIDVEYEREDPKIYGK